MKDIIANNLIRYRKGLDLSQEQLAEKVGVTRATINNYENAKTLPDSKTLCGLARALEVTLDDLLRSPSQGLTNFRFRTHVSFSQKPQLAAQVLRLLETYNNLEQTVGQPPYAPESTPCHQGLNNEKRIIEIAAHFRHRLGLGEAPILNLFASVEDIGLKVLRQPIPIKGFFSLSACSVDQGAFVLINNHEITIERQLFTLAHEIAHLILHRSEYQDNLIVEGTEEEKAQEDVANYFASHLLVPQAEFERMYEMMPNIVKLKQYFRVSYQVILTRLAQMKVIDYAQEKAKISAIYKKRHGTSLSNSMELPPTLDPSDFPENERYKRLIWQALGLGKISEMKAAELLEITVEDLRISRQETEVYAIA